MQWQIKNFLINNYSNKAEFLKMNKITVNTFTQRKVTQSLIQEMMFLSNSN